MQRFCSQAAHCESFGCRPMSSDKAVHLEILLSKESFSPRCSAHSSPFVASSLASIQDDSIPPHAHATPLLVQLGRLSLRYVSSGPPPLDEDVVLALCSASPHRLLHLHHPTAVRFAEDSEMHARRYTKVGLTAALIEQTVLPLPSSAPPQSSQYLPQFSFPGTNQPATMSKNTSVKASVHFGTWDDSTRAHPAMEWMEHYTRHVVDAQAWGEETAQKYHVRSTSSFLASSAVSLTPPDRGLDRRFQRPEALGRMRGRPRCGVEGYRGIVRAVPGFQARAGFPRVLGL